jgi:hypothetical protein
LKLFQQQGEERMMENGGMGELKYDIFDIRISVNARI